MLGRQRGNGCNQISSDFLNNLFYLWGRLGHFSCPVDWMSHYVFCLWKVAYKLQKKELTLVEEMEEDCFPNE